MKVLALMVSLFVLYVNSNHTDSHLKLEWNEFKAKFNRTYKQPSEESKRFQIFAENCEKIQVHNDLYEAGNETFKLGINRYGDLTYDEIVRIHTPNGTAGDDYILLGSSFQSPKYFKSEVNFEMPESFDWRERGVVTPVKDQLPCGSCWAFAAISCVESLHYMKTGKLVDLSEQQLVDCVSDNLGCNGGDAVVTYNYLIHNGISLEEDYPYRAKQGACIADVNKTDIKVLGYAELLMNDEETLKQAVAQTGPVEVSISFVHEKLMRYAEGVYFDPECDGIVTNHAVTVVGYGTDERTKMDYWIVKNSWSELWGESGYIRIARNKDNHCGIATHAIFPLLTLTGSFYSFGDSQVSDTSQTTFFSLKTILVFVMICVAAITLLLLFACFIFHARDEDEDMSDGDEIELNRELVDFNSKTDC